ncbi:MAG: hypothetical protein JSU01_00630 [Bacteroidetes bacterium]|nr:hypothetical protein [Bacteroidota bacterium]
MKRIFTLIAVFVSLTALAQSNVSDKAAEAFQKKDWKTAIQLFKTYRQNNSSDIGSLLYLAYSEANLQDYKAAIPYADSVMLLSGQPNNQNQARLVLARSYAALNNKGQAMQYLEDAAVHGANFYNRLSDTIFSMLRSDEKFKKITEQMKVNSAPCQYDERYKKLNFWLGIWEVYIGNNFENKVAIDTITHGPGDCAIFENFVWTGGGSYKGRSMTFFDPSTQKFRMCWAGSSADIRNFEEIKNEPNMIQFLAITNAPGNQLVHRRMTISYNPSDGSVHQFIENSFDFGRTWEVDFDAMFRKVK